MSARRQRTARCPRSTCGCPRRLMSSAYRSASLRLEVVEQPAALADELQQAAARVMILRVRLEVFGQVVDALAEDARPGLRGSRCRRRASCTMPMSSVLRSLVNATSCPPRTAQTLADCRAHQTAVCLRISVTSNRAQHVTPGQRRDAKARRRPPARARPTQLARPGRAAAPSAGRRPCRRPHEHRSAATSRWPWRARARAASSVDDAPPAGPGSRRASGIDRAARGRRVAARASSSGTASSSVEARRCASAAAPRGARRVPSRSPRSCASDAHVEAGRARRAAASRRVAVDAEQLERVRP